jgi:uncharacterized protein YbjT (DUF2867 family)
MGALHQNQGNRTIVYGRRRAPFIHSEDIAAVSVTALLDEEYAGRILSITGPKTLTFGDATQIIGRAIGKTLAYQTILDEEAGERYSRVSGSPEETAAHVALWRAIRATGAWRQPPIRSSRFLAENPFLWISGI